MSIRLNLTQKQESILVHALQEQINSLLRVSRDKSSPGYHALKDFLSGVIVEKDPDEVILEAIEKFEALQKDPSALLTLDDHYLDTMKFILSNEAFHHEMTDDHVAILVEIFTKEPLKPNLN